MTEEVEEGDGAGPVEQEDLRSLSVDESRRCKIVESSERKWIMAGPVEAKAKESVVGERRRLFPRQLFFVVLWERREAFSNSDAFLFAYKIFCAKI